MGTGRDADNDGIPDTNHTDVLTNDNEDLHFTAQIIFPKESHYRKFYNITVQADTNNKLFDNFSAGDDGGSAGLYKFSDIKEVLNTESNQVQTYNLFQFDFSCKVNKSGGLTINDTNLSINFILTVANSAGMVHPQVGSGVTTSTENEPESDNGTVITNFPPGTTNTGIPVKADQF